jgi:hypothetical protein
MESVEQDLVARVFIPAEDEFKPPSEHALHLTY